MSDDVKGYSAEEVARMRGCPPVAILNAVASAALNLALPYHRLTPSEEFVAMRDLAVTRVLSNLASGVSIGRCSDNRPDSERMYAQALREIERGEHRKRIDEAVGREGG